MAPRANWKGYLKLSLVSCGVALAFQRRRPVNVTGSTSSTATPVTRQVADSSIQGQEKRLEQRTVSRPAG